MSGMRANEGGEVAKWQIIGMKDYAREQSYVLSSKSPSNVKLSLTYQNL